MKRPASKFAKTAPSYGNGGFFGFFDKSDDGAPEKKFADTKFGQYLSSPSGKSMVGGLGMAGAMFGSQQVSSPTGVNDEQYEKDMQKANATQNTLGAVGRIASNLPGVGGLVGAGISLLAKPLGDLFGGTAARNQAMKDAQTRKFQRDLDASTIAGARNINALPAYKAPPYGRRGLRIRMSPPGMMTMRMRNRGIGFNTKFSKPC